MKNILLLLLSIILIEANAQHSHTLWFDKPAEKWDDALFFGNGRLGGIYFGIPEKERIIINEESVWSKGGQLQDMEGAADYLPKVRKMLFEGQYEEAQKLIHENFMDDRLPSGTNTYQELAELSFEFDLPENIKNYRRSLHLDSALVIASFTAGDVNYKRQIFSSYPDQAIYFRITADKPGSISGLLMLSRQESSPEVFMTGKEVSIRESLNEGDGVSFYSRANIINTGGELVPTKYGLQVKNADEVLIIITARTNYFEGNPEYDSRDDFRKAKKDFKEAKENHYRDYNELYSRFSLEIESESDKVGLPTSTRLRKAKEGEKDPGLISQYVQLGRYFLISSSRGEDLPANLQGLWAEGIKPPWNADYHININIQMNYWISEITGLGENHRSFLKFIDELRPSGRKTAKTLYGANGWTAHHTTDAWKATTAFGYPLYGFWPMGAGWTTRHHWEHFLYGGDVEYLKNFSYPIMKEASEFLVDYLVEDPETGLLVSGPSISPENQYITPKGNKVAVAMGASMDHQIIYDNFNNVIAASEVLGIDEDYRNLLRQKLNNLTPPKLGDDGRILEWSRDFEEAEPGHRHMSHLYGLYPGYQFNYESTPEFMKGAERVIEERLKHGGGHTGWSRAWMINFYARLKDSEKAYESIYKLFEKSTLPNLLDSHPPFQIDGNFGAAAGVVEMLLQSHSGIIELGPAIPVEWKSGKIEGVRARGGFIIDFSWKDGLVTDVVIQSINGNPIKLRVNEKNYSGNTQAGESVLLGDLEEE